MSHGIGFSLRVAPELHQKPSLSAGKPRDFFRKSLIALESFDHIDIKALKADRFLAQNLRDRLCGFINRFKAKNDKGPGRRIGDEAELGFQNRHAGSFRPDERARDIKYDFSQKFIQIIAGDAVWCIWLA